MKDPRNSEKALDGLISRSLRRGLSGSAHDCPEPEILAAYCDHSLASAEVTRWEVHFSSCARCHQKLAALIRSDIAALQPARERAAGMAWLWNWRWMAPAATAAAAATLWLAVRPAPLVIPPPADRSEVQLAEVPRSAPEAPGPSPREQLAKEASRLSATRAPSAGKGRFETRTNLPVTRREQEDFAAGARRELPHRSMPPPQVRQSDVVVAIQSQPQAHNLATAAPPQQTIPGAMPSREADEARSKEAKAIALAQPEPAPAQKAESPSAAPVKVAERAAFEPAEKNLEKKQVAIAQGEQAVPPAAPAAASGHKTLARQASIQSGALELRSTDKVEPTGGLVLITSPNPAVLWRVTLAGTIENSRDAAKTWTFQSRPAGAENNALVAGSSPRETVCWLVGHAGTVLRTHDGKNWEKLPPPTPADLISVKARDAMSATVAAADGRRYATSDGGRSWRVL